MKKLLLIISCILLVSVLSGCVSGGYDYETKQIVDAADKEPAADAGESVTEEQNTVSVVAAEDTAVFSELPTIEEQVCFESMGVTVTAKSIVEDEIWGTGIKLLIENNGAKTYSVYVDEMVINDCMITPYFSSEISAGKKANDTLYFSSAELTAAGIENIGKIELYFYIYDDEAFERVYTSDCITLQTSLYASMDTTPDDMGFELYNQGGIRIVGKYVGENSFWGSSVLLYLENKTNQNITVSCDEMSINGFMVTPWFSSTIYVGKYAVDGITILQSDLDDNDITSIEDIELTFHIYNSDTYDTITDTPAISFSVQ